MIFKVYCLILQVWKAVTCSNFVGIERCEAGMIGSENKIEPQQIYQALLNELLLLQRQAIVLLNADGVIGFCTETVKRITGYVREELLGNPVFDFYDPADAGPAKRQYERFIIANGKSVTSCVRLRDKSGNPIWLDAVVKNLLQVPGIHAILVVLKNSCDAGTEERKLAQAVTAAKEEERAFIACELHDNVNQMITATKLLVDGALIKNDNKEELLKLSSANLQFVIEEIRSLSHSMAGYQLHTHGLVFAIEAFIGTISKASPLQFKTKLQESAVMVLTTEQQLQVYRIIQEAVNNILRHAAATLAEIIITRQARSIYLLIKDDGKGFSAKGHSPGIGLSSILNRVKILRGHFHIRTGQNTGTTIEIQFPM